MEIKKAAMAGTLESSDAQVTVEPGNGSIELSIESSVIHQFGKQIRATILETLNRLEVGSAKVTVVDKGALDCTLKARVECAVYRSNDMTENLPDSGSTGGSTNILFSQLLCVVEVWDTFICVHLC